MIETVTAVLVCTAVLACGVFVVRYLMTGWWRTTAGRVVMAFMVTSGGLLTLSLARTILGVGYPGEALVRLLAWAALNGTLWFAVVGLFRIQKGK